MARKVMRVGFDFDGVIAYNPLRVLRRPAMWGLELLRLKKRGELHYPVPSAHPNRFIWAILHETSFFPARGLTELKELLREKKIKAYLITGRYSFLKKALIRWLRYRGIYDLFEKIYISDENEQPHLYKERILKKLKLDMYVEDNLDIVKYLDARLKTQDSRKKNKESVEIHWIYNFLDRNIPYPYKHPYLKGFIEYLKKSKPR